MSQLRGMINKRWDGQFSLANQNPIKFILQMYMLKNTAAKRGHLEKIDPFTRNMSYNSELRECRKQETKRFGKINWHDERTALR